MRGFIERLALIFRFVSNIVQRVVNQAGRTRERTDRPDLQTATAQPPIRTEVDFVPTVVDRYETHQRESTRRDWWKIRIEAATLIVVIVYAAITWCLLRSTEEALKETRRSNELTQRAFVMVPRIDLTQEPYPVVGDPNRLRPGWGIRIALENSGQTPATITASGPFPARALPPAAPEQCPSYKVGSIPTAMIVPPKVPRAYYLFSADLSEAVTWALQDRAKNHITVYIMIEYLDTFTKGTRTVRHSQFCYFLNPLVNRTNIDRYTYIRDNPERSAFSDCSFCNSWD